MSILIELNKVVAWVYQQQALVPKLELAISTEEQYGKYEYLWKLSTESTKPLRR